MITDPANRLPMSVSRCQRRVREPEAQGVVRGYHADVNLAAVGLGFTAAVFVAMQQEDQHRWSASTTPSSSTRTAPARPSNWVT